MEQFINLSDTELISHFYTEKDQQIIETLISRHRNRVITYIRRIVKDDEIAEDIFQDTFIQVIRKLNQFEFNTNTDSGFVSWVLKIARNLIIDQYRKTALPKSISEGKYQEKNNLWFFSKDNYQEESPLNLFFNTDEFNKNDIVEIISVLSEIYRTIGGDGLIITGMRRFNYVANLHPVVL